MKSNSQRGIALVITLMMLAVVTMMAIIFLGVSRRERSSVTVTTSLQDARLAADAGLARAQAEILARIASSSNLLDYDYFVSTNYIRPNGFVPGVSDPENVNYFYGPIGNTNNPVTGDDLLLNLKNLFLDPRPPVFVDVPGSTGKDFRFYLDANRNGRFDTNGWVPWIGNGVYEGPRWTWGDPEWVGVLEHPELPHSSSNRFTMRYAFVALPAGKSLDINFIHNNVKEGVNPFGAYQRNQGVGSWELNLAAFLRTWLPLGRPSIASARTYGSPYRYYPESLNGANDGLAFEHAQLFHLFRLQAVTGKQPTVLSVLGAARAEVLRTNGVDNLGDDVFGQPDIINEDRAIKPYPAYDYRSAQFRAQEFFQTNGARVTLQPIADTLLLAGRSLTDSTNQYALTSLLSQMGTDSIPASRGRVHLNYTNAYWSVDALDPADGLWKFNAGKVFTNARVVVVEGAETNMVPWSLSGKTRQDFFMVAADRILRSQLGGYFPDGLTGGIQVYPTNDYIGAVHRCMQVAANLLDTSTRDVLETPTRTNFFPSVFRPIFTRAPNPDGSNTNLILIVGYQEATSTNFLARPWRDLNNPADRAALQEGDNVLGIPWVIGAKKGWPNFNELYSDTTVTVTRRLLGVKDAAQRVTFKQSYELTVTNFVGVEAWNSYLTNLPARMTLLCTNRMDVVLRDVGRDNGGYTAASLLRNQTAVIGTNMVLNNWPADRPGGSSGFEVFTNSLLLVPRSSYLPSEPLGSSLVPFRSSPVYDRSPSFPVPDWKLFITNRLFYALTAQVGGTNRIVDLVTLNPAVAGFDITRWLQGTNNLVSGTNQVDDQFWQTNRAGVVRLGNGVLDGAPWGVTNQVFVSMSSNRLSNADWLSYSADPVSGRQRERAIDDFRMFMGLPPIYDPRRTNTPVSNMQVPFTAGRRLAQRLQWAANDPLVHYHIEDLYDRAKSDTNNVQVMRPGGSTEGYFVDLPNLGKQNSRTRGWGHQAGEEDANDEFAYNLGVRDPWITRSDDWEFATNAFPNVGWMGRGHRGTPWQTLYLKSLGTPTDLWVQYIGRRSAVLTHPTNDWRLMDVFTATPNPNASRGLLSVNQTNEAAWAAVFDGVRVQTNTAAPSLNPASSASYDRLYIDSASPQFKQLVRGINQHRATNFLGGSFRNMGDILATPALTVQSPYLSLPVDAAGRLNAGVKISDAVLEGLPQQILGLLRKDEPYFVIYSYGQSLRPAERSTVLRPGPFFNLCTNYQITGEVLTKTGFRIVERKQGTNVFYDTVLENFSVLPVD